MTHTAELTAARAGAVLDAVERVVVGKRSAAHLIMLGVLARGHVLIEDLPGVGKTLIARSFASALGLRFTRVQFTPDLLPADLLGSTIYDMQSSRFTLRAGPGRCSPTCCWPTRSTGLHRKPRPRCWRQWPKDR